MRCLLWCVVALLAFAMSAAVPSQAEEPKRPTLEDFLRPIDFLDPELSPNGRYVAGLRRSEDSKDVLIVDLQSKAPPMLFGLGDVRVHWVRWVTGERLVVSVSYRDKNKGWLARLIAVDRTGKNMTVLGETSKEASRIRFMRKVTDFLRDDADHILVSARYTNDLDLFKINVNDGSMKRIARGTYKTEAWYTDREGQPAFRFDMNSRGTELEIFARIEKSDDKYTWRKISTIRVRREREVRESSTEFRPLFPGPEPTTYYVAARPEGEELTGIYLYDFEKDIYVETIAKNSKVDIISAFFDSTSREYLGSIFFEDRLQIDVVDKNIQSHIDGLEEFFKSDSNVLPVQSTNKGRIWLLYVTSPTDAGSYYVYDLDRAHISPIGARRIALMKKSFGRTEIVKYRARDGIEISGYLTRPVGAQSEDRPPLIVMPHGGPWVRDFYDFSDDVQILAAHGYQVFQPNFRGSAGFGKAFEELGKRQWGKAMQTDLDDGFAYLVEAGFADPNRACILGASYGGYASLVAATLSPDLYRCHVSIAGISDLEELMKRERERGGESLVYQHLVDNVGHPRRDREELRAVSPSRHAGQVSGPILLIHGEWDRVVDIEQSERMATALRKKGRDYEFLVLENSSHSRRSDEDEEKEYRAILTFLGKHLPNDMNPYGQSEAAVAVESAN